MKEKKKKMRLVKIYIYNGSETYLYNFNMLASRGWKNIFDR